jgi:hypothetical protein
VRNAAVTRSAGTLAVLVGLALALPPNASAGYYLTKREAESFMRQHVHYALGYDHTAARCRPQGRRRARRGYVYHRWACAWAGMYFDYTVACRGVTVIIGSRLGGYYRRPVYKRGPDC